jgi:hypothetical protein
MMHPNAARRVGPDLEILAEAEGTRALQPGLLGLNYVRLPPA